MGWRSTKSTLPTGNESGCRQGDPEERAGRGDMVLRGVLGKVLQGIQRRVAGLDLVE